MCACVFKKLINKYVSFDREFIENIYFYSIPLGKARKDFST